MSPTTSAPDAPFVDELVAEEQRRRPPSRRGTRHLRPALWRLHFLGAFLAGPVVVSLAVTGILFAWHPQIDALRFGEIMGRTGAEGDVSLAQQVRAAQATRPNWLVTSVTPGHAITQGPDLTTEVVMQPPAADPDGAHAGHGGHGGAEDQVSVYVDDATGEVTGEIEQSAASDQVLRGLHSSWTIGPAAEPLTELAGAWLLVSLMTGVYLWWPDLRRRGPRVLALRRRAGRRASKDRHTRLGVVLWVPLALLAVTGLTWSTFSGERYDELKAALSTPEALQADTALAATAPGQSSVERIDIVLRRAREAALQEPFTISLPEDDATAWRVKSDDDRLPMRRDQIAVDGRTGRVVAATDYSDEHWVNKLTTAGIQFHQGQLLGLASQVLMTLLALCVIALVLLGYRMWWQRRPAGALARPPAPIGWRRVPLAGAAAFAALAYALPTLALAWLAWGVADRAAVWSQNLRGPGGPRPASGPADIAVAAGLLAVGGIMLARPRWGDDDDLDPLVAAVAWAWSTPVTAALLLVGAVGMAAVTRQRRRDQPGRRGCSPR